MEVFHARAHPMRVECGQKKAPRFSRGAGSRSREAVAQKSRVVVSVKARPTQRLEPVPPE
jgi:hypothetical protein